MLPAIERIQANPYEWRGGETRADGSMQMHYVEYAPEVAALISAVYARNISIAYDWGAWQDEARSFLDANVVARASLDEVRRLLTLHVRKDRFVEGHLGGMVECGHVAALLRRLRELVDA
jgi:hypothetical protein